MNCKTAELTKEEKKILNMLLDKYERSATFRGDNSVKQSFSIKPEEAFAGYKDDALYELFVAVNEAVKGLREKGLTEYTERNRVVLKVSLKPEYIADSYRLLKRIPKDQTLHLVKNFLEEKKLFLERTIGTSETEDVRDALRHYIASQEERLRIAKLPEYYEDPEEYYDLWKLLEFLSEEHAEAFIRDVSVKLYKDSKRLEKLAGKAQSLLYKYGDYPEKEMILQECSLLHTPAYVMCRGCMRLKLGGQVLDIGKLSGDIAFSSETLKDISEAEIYGRRLITIENLTTFHRFAEKEDDVIVYLGGFHNTVKREFLKMLYRNNTGLSCYHFGDIDAGGFYIFDHLREKTAIPFRPMHMSIRDLEEKREYTKKLTANDRERLRKLITRYENSISQASVQEREDAAEILKTIYYMLEKDIKLEQEAL